jgi:hypothetical protein
MSSKRFSYDYYRIPVPGDMFDGEDAFDLLSDAAISEARDKARLYCVPAEWSCSLINGRPGDSTVTFNVRRKRSKAS